MKALSRSWQGPSVPAPRGRTRRRRCWCARSRPPTPGGNAHARDPVARRARRGDQALRSGLVRGRGVDSRNFGEELLGPGGNPIDGLEFAIEGSSTAAAGSRSPSSGPTVAAPASTACSWRSSSRRASVCGCASWSRCRTPPAVSPRSRARPTGRWPCGGALGLRKGGAHRLQPRDRASSSRAGDPALEGASVDQPIRPDVAQDRGRDLLDRLVRRATARRCLRASSCVSASATS